MKNTSHETYIKSASVSSIHLFKNMIMSIKLYIVDEWLQQCSHRLQNLKYLSDLSQKKHTVYIFPIKLKFEEDLKEEWDDTSKEKE